MKSREARSREAEKVKSREGKKPRNSEVEAEKPIVAFPAMLAAAGRRVRLRTDTHTDKFCGTSFLGTNRPLAKLMASPLRGSRKWETQKGAERGDAQTSDQDKALEAAAETLPTEFGRQNTLHQVLRHFVIVSHAA